MRTLIRVALCWAILVALCLIGQAPSVAHAELVASSPTSGERLSTSPAQVVLEFARPVVGDQSRLLVLDADSRVHPSTLLTSDTGTVLVAVLDPDVPAGTWTIAYEVLTLDGHRLDGSIPFAVRSGTVTPSATRTSGWAIPALLLVLSFALCAAVRAMPELGDRPGT